MIAPFNVISNRSGQRRTVYAVSFHELPYFLIYRNGEWIWEESRWYEPIDTAQVVQGRWIPIEYDGYANGNPVWDLWECSECQEEHSGDEETLTPYCPNCGAKMDGGTNGKT